MRLIFLIVIFIGLYSLYTNDSPKELWKVQEIKKPKIKKIKKPKPSGECIPEISKEFFRVVKQIDSTHYLLVNVENNSNTGHINFETDRSLPVGEIVNIGESTYLGVEGDPNNFTVLWREGCIPIK